MRKRAIKQCKYIVKQQRGVAPITVNDLNKMLENGDTSIAKQVLHFGACLRCTSQYWAQRNKKLQSLSQFQINEGKVMQSFFMTASCAEYHFKSFKTSSRIICI